MRLSAPMHSLHQTPSHRSASKRAPGKTQNPSPPSRHAPGRPRHAWPLPAPPPPPSLSDDSGGLCGTCSTCSSTCSTPLVPPSRESSSPETDTNSPARGSCHLPRRPALRDPPPTSQEPADGSSDFARPQRGAARLLLSRPPASPPPFLPVGPGEAEANLSTISPCLTSTAGWTVPEVFTEGEKQGEHGGGRDRPRCRQGEAAGISAVIVPPILPGQIDSYPR